MVWISAVGGVRPATTREEVEELTGTREGDRLVLNGTHRVTVRPTFPPRPGVAAQTTVAAVRYELRLDRKTGHLVGTRDGQPLWLARFKVLPGNCPAPPP